MAKPDFDVTRLQDVYSNQDNILPHSCHNLTYFHYKPLRSPCYCQAAAPGQLLVVLGGGEFGKPRGEEACLDVPLGG